MKKPITEGIVMRNRKILGIFGAALLAAVMCGSGVEAMTGATDEKIWNAIGKKDSNELEKLEKAYHSKVYGALKGHFYDACDRVRIDDLKWIKEKFKKLVLFEYNVKEGFSWACDGAKRHYDISALKWLKKNFPVILKTKDV